MSLASDAIREVQARHDFFVARFTGHANEDAMAGTARAFAPDFVRIGPDGGTFDRASTLTMLWKARRTPDFAIRTEILEAVELSEGIARVTYDELQHLDGTDTARRATAVFSVDARAPCGVAWRFVQETWISRNRSATKETTP